MDFVKTAAAIDSIQCDLVAIGVPEGTLAESLSRLGMAAAADLQAAAETEEFKGKPGALLVFPCLSRLACKRVALVGTGSRTPDELRRAAGAVTAACRSRGVEQLVLALGDLDEAGTVAVVEGAVAGNYVYDRFKPEDGRKPALARVALADDFDADAVDLGLAIAAGQQLARDLVNAPAAQIHPESLAHEAAELSRDADDTGTLTVEVWDETRIADAGMGGIIAVGQGSSRPPRFVHMCWKPAGTPRKRLALVGKGVTFDSGGLSLKPSASMLTMRCDMAGSAAVVGVMRALRDIRPDVEVHAIFGAAENMNSGSSYKLGDILTMHNGKTVEVHNTDAEGRLVLADCLSYADGLGVDAIVDLATLTGACVVALGSDYSALFARDDNLARGLQDAADGAGEYVWRMPMPEHYKELLKAKWGALKNVGGREAGSITAALFLGEFVDDTPWAHLDIAGPAFRDKPFRHLAPGGSGAMVPSLVRWILA